MNEQPNQPQPPLQPQQPVAQPAPQPIAPGYQGQPLSPPPDPSLYQPPAVPITSHAQKLPIWLFIVIGVTFLAAVGLLVAVFVLM